MPVFTVSDLCSVPLSGVLTELLGAHSTFVLADPSMRLSRTRLLVRFAGSVTAAHLRTCILICPGVAFGSDSARVAKARLLSPRAEQMERCDSPCLEGPAAEAASESSYETSS